MKTFEEMPAWQRARELTREVYAVTRDYPFSKDYALSSQIRRAAVSIMANIAEGFERDGTPEFLQFLSISKGSLAEVKTHLFIAFDQSYIDQPQFTRLMNLSTNVSRQIAGFMKYLRGAEIKGIKHKRSSPEIGLARSERNQKSEIRNGP